MFGRGLPAWAGTRKIGHGVAMRSVATHIAGCPTGDAAGHAWFIEGQRHMRAMGRVVIGCCCGTSMVTECLGVPHGHQPVALCGGCVRRVLGGHEERRVGRTRVGGDGRLA